ncbi:hypothetical protein KOR42_24890 [Thalassoglobus neptunius]|uniref:DUF3352 domain-containing protein n=1 Tax=Thalassoglobus neptunius TaxID=1938619 RepID=A0A5C5X852_9PLAN|nr:hypothetical protein [Thalassoglobus neptunius]TWT59100.1 hypothetical protein KOR42_24890 [Thalassoglobus neptunius]
MNAFFDSRFLLFALTSLALLTSPVQAQTAIELLPETTVIFAEVQHPHQLVESVLAHPVSRKVQDSNAYREALKDPNAMGFLFVVRFIEAQIGMPWQKAIETLAAGGVTIAVDSRTEGVVALMKSNDPEKLASTLDKVIQLARSDAENKGEDDPFEEREYRGLKAYGKDGGGFFVYEDWLILVNKADTARDIADALLDGRETSLADSETFQEALQHKTSEDISWAFVETEPLRRGDNDDLRKLFSGIADNPGGEFILGGILEALKDAPYLTASLSAKNDTLTLDLKIPFERTSLSENREHFFGPRGTGHAAETQEISGLLFSISAYRYVSEMWLRAGDLFDAKANDNLAQADSTLTTLFSGKDFAEDILGALEPTFQIVGMRQSFSEDRPTPAIKIPAFALLAEMKDPETTTREFRRIFQSFIGFLNIVGAMEGQPQYELGQLQLDEGEIVSATFIPEVGEETARDAKIHFNFSPTLAFSGNQLILASTTDFARTLITSDDSGGTEKTGDSDQVINTLAEVSLPELQRVLADNESHLIAQNMLKEGHSQEEAKRQIRTLFEILNLFEEASLQLLTDEHHVDLKLDVVLQPSE